MKLAIDRKELKDTFNFNNDEIREIIECIIDEQEDFEISNNYRIIKESVIDDIMQEELSNDEYILGCFNAWFLADVLEIDLDVIEEMQKAEAFSAIGKLVLSLGKLEELQKQYVKYDGYGHHFNHWDGSDEEIRIGKEYYHIFRV